MSKQGEHAYVTDLGEHARNHMMGKPFSDENCGLNLMAIGTIISLLPPTPARILDLGCGSGWTSLFLARAGYRVTGQDLVPEMIDLARESARLQAMEANADFVVSDFEGLEFAETFEAAMFFDSLHHAEDEALAIRSAWRALKPGGLLITHEPGEGHAAHPHSVEAMERFGVTERDMPPHLIIKRGEEAGFTEFRVLPLPQYLHQIFYEKRVYPKHWLSKTRWRWRRRALESLFKPDLRIGSIVVMVK